MNYWTNNVSTLYHADAREIPLPDASVHCVVTSPPYWGLRDYGLGEWEGGEAECGHEVIRKARPDLLNGRGEPGPNNTSWSNRRKIAVILSAASAEPSGKRRALGLSQRWANGWRTSSR